MTVSLKIHQHGDRNFSSVTSLSPSKSLPEADDPIPRVVEIWRMSTHNTFCFKRQATNRFALFSWKLRHSLWDMAVYVKLHRQWEARGPIGNLLSELQDLLDGLAGHLGFEVLKLVCLLGQFTLDFLA